MEKRSLTHLPRFRSFLIPISNTTPQELTMDKGTVIVTGANSGIGLACVNEPRLRK